MTSETIIGLSGPDYLVPIEWGAIRRFARCLYSSLPAWLEDPKAVVPPTFLVMAGYHWGYILERPPVGSELATIEAAQHGNMDGEQSFEFFGSPPRVGDVLTASTVVADHYEKRGKIGGKLEFFLMKTEFRDQSGRLVARWMPLSIRTETPDEPSSSETTKSREQAWLQRGEYRTNLDAIHRATGKLAVGDSAGEIEMPALTLTESIRYQGASGEDSPAHHDRLAAIADGLPDVLSVGMHHAGVLGAYAAHWLGPENVRSFKARFLRSIWMGDVLSYRGKVASLGQSAEGPTVQIELECLRGGEPVVRAKAEFIAPSQS